MGDVMVRHTIIQILVIATTLKSLNAKAPASWRELDAGESGVDASRFVIRRFRIKKTQATSSLSVMSRGAIDWSLAARQPLPTSPPPLRIQKRDF